MIQKVAIIGAGRLAWSLIPHLQQAGVEVFQLISRNAKNLNHYRETYDIPHGSLKLADLRREVDLVFLTVRDAAIEELAQRLVEEAALSPRQIFVHSSGSVPLSALQPLRERKAVFYPLQIFTRDSITSFADTPLFVEGEGEVEEVLLSLARKMSPRVYQMDSQSRLRMHMGAVIACNFPNYLFQLAQKQLPQEKGLKLDIYAPLIEATVDKALKEGPENSQTGPAIRGDKPTLDQHEKLLEDQPEVQHLYRLLSRMINPEIDT